MDTLLQHMKPWMQHFTIDSKAKMDQMIDQKVQVIHNRLDDFVLRFLERTTSTIDVTTFYHHLSNICANVATLIDPLILSMHLPHSNQTIS